MHISHMTRDWIPGAFIHCLTAALDELEAKWGQQYPVVLQSWRRKRENLSAYFRYPANIRKVIYTTNAIESVHRKFRKLTKT